jgi:hypothetical protein
VEAYRVGEQSANLNLVLRHQRQPISRLNVVLAG